MNKLSLKEFIITRKEVSGESISLSCIIYENNSTDKAIILCHGMFSDKNNSINMVLVEKLIEIGSIIIFDFSGNGKSSGEWRYAGYQREVRDIFSVAEYSENVLNKKVFAIIGHSKAGADVYLTASSLKLKEDICCFVSLSGRITFGKKEKRFSEDDLKKAEKEGYFIWEHKGKKWKIYQEDILERRNMNPINEVKNIPEGRRKRILQIHGTNDTSTSTDEPSVILREIPGSEVIWIEGADHFYTGKIKEMSEELLKWLKSKI